MSHCILRAISIAHSTSFDWAQYLPWSVFIICWTGIHNESINKSVWKFATISDDPGFHCLHALPLHWNSTRLLKGINVSKTYTHHFTIASLSGIISAHLPATLVEIVIAQAHQAFRIISSSETLFHSRSWFVWSLSNWYSNHWSLIIVAKRIDSWIDEVMSKTGLQLFDCFRIFSTTKDSKSPLSLRSVVQRSSRIEGWCDGISNHSSQYTSRISRRSTASQNVPDIQYSESYLLRKDGWFIWACTHLWLGIGRLFRNATNSWSHCHHCVFFCILPVLWTSTIIISFFSMI